MISSDPTQRISTTYCILFLTNTVTNRMTLAINIFYLAGEYSIEVAISRMLCANKNLELIRKKRLSHQSQRTELFQLHSIDGQSLGLVKNSLQAIQAGVLCRPGRLRFFANPQRRVSKIKSIWSTYHLLF